MGRVFSFDGRRALLTRVLCSAGKSVIYYRASSRAVGFTIGDRRAGRRDREGGLTVATLPSELVMRHRLTVDDYHRMAESGILGSDDRVELIAGEVIDMSPIGSLHAALVAAMSEYLGRLAAGRLTVWSQTPSASAT
jgi:hypothetical protein